MDIKIGWLFREFSYTFGSRNTFLYNLCYHMVLSLWDFSANITLPPTPVLTSIIISSSHRVPPPRFLFFQSHTNSHKSIPLYTHQNIFSIYGIRMPSWHSKITCVYSNSITKFIPRNQDRNDLHFYNFYNVYSNIKHIYKFGKIVTLILLLSFFCGKAGAWLRPITQIIYTECSHNC